MVALIRTNKKEVHERKHLPKERRRQKAASGDKDRQERRQGAEKQRPRRRRKPVKVKFTTEEGDWTVKRWCGQAQCVVRQPKAPAKKTAISGQLQTPAKEEMCYGRCKQSDHRYLTVAM